MVPAADHLSEVQSDPRKSGATHPECRVAASPVVVKVRLNIWRKT